MTSLYWIGALVSAHKGLTVHSYSLPLGTSPLQLACASQHQPSSEKNSFAFFQLFSSYLCTTLLCFLTLLCRRVRFEDDRRQRDRLQEPVIDRPAKRYDLEDDDFMDRVKFLNWLLCLCQWWIIRICFIIYIFVYIFYPSQYQVGTGSWNTCTQKTKTHLYCRANIMVADDLVMQGAKTSAAMVLT